MERHLGLRQYTLQDSCEHLFSYANNENISLAWFLENPEPINQFALPLSLETNNELDTLMSKLDQLALDNMAPDD